MSLKLLYQDQYQHLHWGFIGETLKTEHMWKWKSGLEHRRALCYWILIVTATPATVAETNLWLSEYNARVTQIGPITLTICPFAQKQVLLSSNHWQQP